LLAATEVASLKAWVGSPAHKALLRCIEVRAIQYADQILAGDDSPALTRARGRLDAYEDVYTLAERLIPTLEEYYARERAREQRATDARGDDGGIAAHWGSPTFRRHWDATR
jgi:hypothetical protein